ncbi:MAG: CoA-binding protein [Hyphomicrobium sp.]
MTADRNSNATIDSILASARVFAVIGASNKPERASFGVIRSLLDHGYIVHPVNPGLAGHQIHGRTVYATLAGVPSPVDVVDIFRNASDALAAVRDAIQLRQQLGITVVWMQLGVINVQAANEAEAAGMIAVMDRCPRIEFARASRR